MNQTLLTIDAYVALTAVLFNFVFAVLLMVRTSRTIVYITFFFICISVMIWNLGDFLFYFTGKRFWFYFSLIGSGMLPAFAFHFICTLVMPEKKIIPWVLPPYVFSGLLAVSPPLAMFHPGIQQFVDGIYWNVCYYVLLVPFLLSCIIMLFNAMKKAKYEDEKSRLRYIFVATLIGIFAGLTDLVQVLKVSVPPLGHLGSVFYSSILAIGVFKHRTTYDILAQMRTKLEVLSEMAASIAHEIRNPLSSIKGAANLLSHELKNLNNSKSREYALLITEEIERLNNILVNFQYFTKPLKIEKNPVSINEVIQKTVKLTESDTLNIKIRMELSQDIPMVQADALPMKQVFLNLIKNAAEACGSNCELVIKTEYSAPWVKIIFSDNGQGISQELLTHIFEPFFTTKTTGMGVGLAISQKIIQAHNGKIEVKNLIPTGTQFTILLPV
ncbi:MAG: ATP-binding protein [Nitrospirota bacterium]|nr:ATP-binding protein [Nitrospirota bacterium]